MTNRISPSDAFRAALLARFAQRRRRTLGEEDIREAFLSLFPEAAHAADCEARIVALLDELEPDIRQPRDRAAYEHFGRTRFPKWIRRVEPAAPAPTPVPPTQWLPELEALSTALRPERLGALEIINRYLIEHRGRLSIVPLRERMLRIFGDEKRADTLGLKDGGLFEGRLELPVIFACDPPLPFVLRQPTPALAGRPLLVLENHHTFESFCHANERRRWFSGVAYGAGSAFSKSAGGLDDAMRTCGATSLLYFGDIDPRGIQIPLGVAHARQRKEPQPAPLRPALACYACLLDSGVKTPLKPQKPTPARAMAAAVEWLGAELGRRAAALWEQGWRLPQEGLELDALDR